MQYSIQSFILILMFDWASPNLIIAGKDTHLKLIEKSKWGKNKLYMEQHSSTVLKEYFEKELSNAICIFEVIPLANFNFSKGLIDNSERWSSN